MVASNVPSSHQSHAVAPVATLDMSVLARPSWDRSNFRIARGNSLRNTGFAMLTAHGIDPQLMESAYQAAAKVFDLPEAIKNRYAVVDSQVGYSELGKEHAKDSPTADNKEFWMVRKPRGVRENVWPAEVPEFQEVFERLFAEFHRVSQELLGATEAYIRADPGSLTSMCTGEVTSIRIIRYPACDGPTTRSAAHEDINVHTLLLEERIRVNGVLTKRARTGLELKRHDTGEWQDIVQPSGSIIEDTGDMLMAYTKANTPHCVLRSTTHRVMATGPEPERLMVVCFVHFDENAVVCTRNGQPITAKQLLYERLVEIGNIKV